MDVLKEGSRFFRHSLSTEIVSLTINVSFSSAGMGVNLFEGRYDSALRLLANQEKKTFEWYNLSLVSLLRRLIS